MDESRASEIFQSWLYLSSFKRKLCNGASIYDVCTKGGESGNTPTCGKKLNIHWISVSTWDLGLEQIHAISDFAL